ncbi:MAG: response regulator [Halobacteriales archaeon]
MPVFPDSIHVLHVDDEPGFADTIAAFLENENDLFVVRTATSAADGLAILADRDVDCIISDYEMPGRNGIEFLEAVREDHPDLPFIVYTGRGSEEVASDAISAGVTDYLRKETGSDHYMLLAARIEAAVSQRRTERELTRQNDLFAKSRSIVNVGAWEYDPIQERSYLTDEVLEIHGLDPGDHMLPEDSIEYYHPEDRPAIREAFFRAIEEGEPYDLELRLIDDDGIQRWVQTHCDPRMEDGTCLRLRGTIQDITEHKGRERELERQVDRLTEFTGVVSHDLQNPLNVAQGYLAQARDDRDDEDLSTVAEALARMESILEDTLTLARQGQTVADKAPVPIADVVDRCQSAVDADAADFNLVNEFTVYADRNRLLQILENLFVNAVEHASRRPQSETAGNGMRYSPTSRRPRLPGVADDRRESVTVRIGMLSTIRTSTRADSDRISGFYIEDDGPGIPPERRQSVFDPGESTRADGTGFGLTIVKRVAEAHGWTVDLTESAEGGARFEFTGVEFVEQDA